MSADSPHGSSGAPGPDLPPERLPTLTEVVVSAPVEPALLADLQARVDLMFEYRVREALTPVLEKLMAEVLAQARVELSGALREVVARAVREHAAQGPAKPTVDASGKS